MGYWPCVVVVLLVSMVLMAEGRSNNIVFENYQRPAESERSFVSSKIEEVIEEVGKHIGDAELRRLWTNCFPNTLDTTINYRAGIAPDTFVITGDLAAMWLRDSSWQVDCYLSFAKEDRHLRSMLKGVVNRQLYSVLLDPYANAFNYNNNSDGHQHDQRSPPMTPGVFEGKWEVDSLCSVLHLVNSLYEVTEDESLLSPQWVAVVRRIYEVFRYQQTPHALQTPGEPLYYKFFRSSEHLYDGPCPVRSGLIKTSFRPSDDAATYPYFIPSNAFAVVELKRTAQLLQSHVSSEKELVHDLLALAKEVDEAIHLFGTVSNPQNRSQTVFAFEVDGCGNYNLLDDANVPSLLSLPFIGYVAHNHPIYANTRKLLLSEHNPFYHSGSAGAGIGSPHTFPDSIWPMGQIFQIMTSDDPTEIYTVLQSLVKSSAGTGLLHEAYHKNDPHRYSRPWFSMCNSLFGQMILQLHHRYPSLLSLTEPPTLKQVLDLRLERASALTSDFVRGKHHF